MGKETRVPWDRGYNSRMPRDRPGWGVRAAGRWDGAQNPRTGARSLGEPGDRGEGARDKNTQTASGAEKKNFAFDFRKK